MAVFVYSGLAVASGKKVNGVRDADNPKMLRAQLKREGVLLTEAAEEKRGKKQGRSINIGAFFNRVSIGDVAMLTRQLATLVGAGIPLVESVSALIEQVEKEELQKTLALVRDRLNEGIALAKALEPFPHIFPPIYTNMVAAGEVSGMLETVLERLADFMEKQAHLRSKVGGALAYPILMLLLGTGLTAAASAALNQWMEINRDRKMPRTRNRPLPAGRLSPTEALLFGLVLAALWGVQQAQKRPSSANRNSPAAIRAAASTPAATRPEAATASLTLGSNPASWVEVRDNRGVTLFRGTLSASRRFPLSGAVRVLAGRPDLVRAAVGSNPARPLGSINDVRWRALTQEPVAP